MTPVSLAYTLYGSPESNKKPPLIICHGTNLFLAFISVKTSLPGLFGQKTNWNSVAKAMQKRLNNVIYAVDLRLALCCLWIGLLYVVWVGFSNGYRNHMGTFSGTTVTRLIPILCRTPIWPLILWNC